ncbi:hypothetical protein C8Q74DRAFT_1255154 [Fomes fomentarius]|nr:hypothetical protein C8Q74DRAFT_1255154 [Fomes fomentarius]
MHMPTLYGEGRKAFRRLQEEIIMVSLLLLQQIFAVVMSTVLLNSGSRRKAHGVYHHTPWYTCSYTYAYIPDRQARSILDCERPVRTSALSGYLPLPLFEQ